MKRLFLSLALTLITTPLVACVETEEDLGADEAELHGPLVAPSGPLASMLVRFHGSPGSRGSSTLIRPDMVLTNRHVVDWTGPGTIYVQVGDAPVIEVDGYEVVAKWQSPTADLAILQLECGFHPADIAAVPLSRSNKDYLKAESVTLSGYGPTSWAGNDYGIKRQGTIALPSPAFSWGTIWSTAGVIGSAPGDSGGSMYFNIAGERILAGVTTWGSSSDAAHVTSGQRVDANLAWIDPILTNTPARPRCPRL
jgi:Trypsin